MATGISDPTERAVSLRRRPWRVRLWRHYREYRRIGLSQWRAIIEAWRIAS